MRNYMSHFEDNGKVNMDISHPADAIPHFLAGANKDSTLLRVKQLENWYREYVEVRNNTQLYKGCADFVLSLSSDFQYKQINEYIHVVLEGHKFHIPIFYQGFGQNDGGWHCKASVGGHEATCPIQNNAVAPSMSNFLGKMNKIKKKLPWPKTTQDMQWCWKGAVAYPSSSNSFLGDLDDLGI